MRNERLRGYLDGIILAILREGDSYGYEIAHQVNLRTKGALVLKEGSLYPSLKRLEAHRFIAGYWGQSHEESGPRRRYYALTDQGQVHLKQLRTTWVTEQQLMATFFGEVVPE